LINTPPNKNKKDSNKQPASFIKTNIVISYLVLFLAAASVFFITYKKIAILTQEDRAEAISKEKIRYINEIFSGLYDAENFIIPMIIDTSAFNLYSNKIDSVRYIIDTLKTLSDSFEQNRLDTVLFLLDEKQENLLNLIMLRGNSSLDELYRKSILKAISKENLLKNHQTIETKIIVKQDTVSYSKPSPRKNFFQRLSEAFSGSDPDTSVEVRSSQYTIVDSSLNYYNPADSISKIFDDIQRSIQREKARFGAIIFSEITILRENNNLLTLQLNSILRNFQQEEFARSYYLFDQREETIRKLKSIITVIAILSLLSILIFTALIWRDITKSKLYRRQLEDANNTTRSLLETREKLMVSITHDIKAPLGSIIGYIELLSNSKLTDRQLHYIDNMKSSSEHLLHLITDILDFNRLETGKIQLHSLPFEPKKLFEEIATCFQPLAEKKGLSLLFGFNSPIETVDGDLLRIRQITNNLLSNAIKFTDEGEVKLIVSLEERENQDKCLLKIIVSDTGKGISEANQKRIFQEYERVESPNLHIEGFGLGLSIVQRLVEIQHGKISLSSKEGIGSSFTIELPLMISKKNLSTTGFSDSDLKILIVDDDNSQLVMVSEQLKRIGIEGTMCNNPVSAIELLEKETFDMILTDIQMPELNGFEFIKLIRNSHLSNATSIPVVALSARADISSSVFEEYGFSSFLNKPFTSEQLFNVVSHFLTIKMINEEKQVVKQKDTTKFDKLFSFAGGEKAAEKAILESFINESKINVANLVSFREQNKLEEINKLSHKMLPLFRMINQTAIVEWLSAMEKAYSPEQLNWELFSENIEKIRTIIKEGEDLLIFYK
jgi:signal transduction histidine kinase/CheY-like chemotaxis protein